MISEKRASYYGEISKTCRREERRRWKKTRQLAIFCRLPKQSPRAPGSLEGEKAGSLGSKAAPTLANVVSIVVIRSGSYLTITLVVDVPTSCEPNVFFFLSVITSFSCSTVATV